MRDADGDMGWDAGWDVGCGLGCGIGCGLWAGMRDAGWDASWDVGCRLGCRLWAGMRDAGWDAGCQWQEQRAIVRGRAPSAAVLSASPEGRVFPRCPRNSSLFSHRHPQSHLSPGPLPTHTTELTAGRVTKVSSSPGWPHQKCRLSHVCALQLSRVCGCQHVQVSVHGVSRVCRCVHASCHACEACAQTGVHVWCVCTQYPHGAAACAHACVQEAVTCARGQCEQRGLRNALACPPWL